jgi:hypothetical protein
MNTLGSLYLGVVGAEGRIAPKHVHSESLRSLCSTNVKDQLLESSETVKGNKPELKLMFCTHREYHNTGNARHERRGMRHRRTQAAVHLSTQ